jgi:putative phosphoribosyl transferase
MAIFKDRRDTGIQLSKKLRKYSDREDVIVLGLPRGGVPVAYEVAKTLKAPLDVFIVRKLGVPRQPELAMGAIASGGVRVMNENIVSQSGVTYAEITEIVEKEQKELQKREEHYRGVRPDIDIAGKIVLLVDDGLATGATMRAAISALKQLDLKKIVIAVPTAPADTCQDFESSVDDLICLNNPSPFWGVGRSYQNFSQTSSVQVREFITLAGN